MPNNPEKEPAYLQDVAIPKEEERGPEGFDLDQEFNRKGVSKETRENFVRAIHNLLASRDWEGAAAMAANFRVLFGRGFWSGDQERAMVKALEDDLDASRRDFVPHYVRQNYFIEPAVFYRILTGHTYLTREEEAQIAQELRKLIKSDLAHPSHCEAFFATAATKAAWYRILFNEIAWAQEDAHKMQEVIKKEYSGDGSPPPRFPLGSTSDVLALRILKAQELRFTDQGLEILDTSPSPPRKEIPPAPEERVF